MINQTYKNIEIIIIDDNSTDKSYEISKELEKLDARIVVIKSNVIDNNRFDKKLNRNINAGWSARNTGINKANGELITFQDADDISLLNRIEIQYNLLIKYGATSIVIDWLKLENHYIGKHFNFQKYLLEYENSMIKPEAIYKLSQKSKGLFPKIFPKLNSKIPFYIKRKRIINKLFFGTLDAYPGTGNSPLFKKEVVRKVIFRHLNDRIWPSFMGRGADRDFNFQVAETFKNSYVILIPAYMWRVDRQNTNLDLEKIEIDKYLY